MSPGESVNSTELRVLSTEWGKGLRVEDRGWKLERGKLTADFRRLTQIFSLAILARYQ